MPNKRLGDLSVPVVAFAFAIILAGFFIYTRATAEATPSAAANNSPALAAYAITGTVIWKETGDPAVNIRVVASDPDSHQVVSEARTDNNGIYMMLVGVGNWLVEVPSTDDFFGYGQLVTVLPHESHGLDFGITSRPPTPTPGPTSTATAVPPVQPTATLQALLTGNGNSSGSGANNSAGSGTSSGASNSSNTPSDNGSASGADNSSDDNASVDLPRSGAAAGNGGSLALLALGLILGGMALLLRQATAQPAGQEGTR